MRLSKSRKLGRTGRRAQGARLPFGEPPSEEISIDRVEPASQRQGSDAREHLPRVRLAAGRCAVPSVKVAAALDVGDGCRHVDPPQGAEYGQTQQRAVGESRVDLRAREGGTPERKKDRWWCFGQRARQRASGESTLAHLAPAVPGKRPVCLLQAGHKRNDALRVELIQLVEQGKHLRMQREGSIIRTQRTEQAQARKSLRPSPSAPAPSGA